MLYYIVVYQITLHYITLNYIKLNYAMLYHIVSYHMMGFLGCLWAVVVSAFGVQAGVIKRLYEASSRLPHPLHVLWVYLESQWPRIVGTFQ